MRIFKNITCFLLIFSMILGFNLPTYSKEINQITQTNTSARVLKVLDGDTIKIELPTKDTAYVKLKGVNAKGFDESYNYLTDTLLGQDVTLVKDRVSYKDGKYNYMIVYCNGVNINNELIKNGYAIIDNTQDRGSTYKTLLELQEEAKKEGFGMWKFENENYSSITGFTSPNDVKTDNRININTATREQLETLLKGVSSNLSREIIKYREKNPFSNIQEIKFVKGFTKKIYDENKNALTVSTNINKANRFELKTLNNLPDKDIDKIIDQRSKVEFTSTRQLSNIISETDYKKVSDYVAIKDRDTVDARKNSNKANISLSNKSYLKDADVPSDFANDIIAYRKNGYTYKTLMELVYLGTRNITEQDIHYLQDNLDIFTNINTDDIDELTPVFSYRESEKIKNRRFSKKDEIKDIISESDYNKVKDAISIDKNIDEYININTATKEQMKAQGLSTNEAHSLTQKRPIKNAGYLPFDVTNINNKISLYTNINTASKKELMSLNNGINDTLINKIIKYRESDNFGSLEEVQEFFITNNAIKVYDKIKEYIVLR